MSKKSTPTTSDTKHYPSHHLFVGAQRIGALWPTQKHGYSVRLDDQAAINTFDGSALVISRELVLVQPKDPGKDDAPLFYAKLPRENGAWITCGSVYSDAAAGGFELQLWSRTASLKLFAEGNVTVLAKATITPAA